MTSGVALAAATIGFVVASVFRAPRNWIRRHVLGSTWFDVIVPWESPIVQEEADPECLRKTQEREATKDRIQRANVDALKASVNELAALEELEAERRRGVDTRLATIVGLASVAATIATGLIVAQASGSLRIPNSSGRWALSGLAFYIVIQLCDAIYWAVRGQERKDYQSDAVEDALPKPTASEEERLRQRIISLVAQLHFNQNGINCKVTAMAVAHRATKNFVCALVVLSLVAMFTIGVTPMTVPVLEQLQTNAQVRDMLRGPAGPQGPQGQMGPAGSIGPRGPKGEAAPAKPAIKSCLCGIVPK